MKIFLVILGFISLGIGIAGIFLPILPTTPFLLLTVFCFSRGSERFHNWFIETKVYKKYVLNYKKKKAMTLREKLVLLLSVFAMLSISFYFAPPYWWLRLMLASVMIGHVIYFGFVVKTTRVSD
ncbi:YbaN family protein [Moheibacter sediminis]|uniref:Inner membrane protein n=1 Tax=Moheibacter sediminis TaxID=1434700 RepID=A0A1W2BQ05_9FLAO|nr:YbaN family protein [Moheibacter sediminis]SMC74973.1 hypothetical protein SAMN06296427_10734 [Moheibacter sediminis]